MLGIAGKKGKLYFRRHQEEQFRSAHKYPTTITLGELQQ
jgi:hypothetical protein